MWVRVAIAIFLLLLPTALHAQAEKRIALLIGNQGYDSEIGRLANPHNDVALLEKTLKVLGFEVRTVRDAGLAGLHQAVNAYARRVRADKCRWLLLLLGSWRGGCRHQLSHPR